MKCRYGAPRVTPARAPTAMNAVPVAGGAAMAGHTRTREVCGDDPEITPGLKEFSPREPQGDQRVVEVVACPSDAVGDAGEPSRRGAPIA
ncbi:hypothetical protein GCM10010176_088980 [Nonomuraea spiralis]|nr:hypothetical protein GCM10010176_088980 [Nonomuraea spiralis]